jgi:hypothetical protein
MDQKKVLVSRKRRKEKILLPGSHPDESFEDESVLLYGKDVLSQVDRPVIVAVDKLKGKSGLAEKPEQALRINHVTILNNKKNRSRKAKLKFCSTFANRPENG